MLHLADYSRNRNEGLNAIPLVLEKIRFVTSSMANFQNTLAFLNAQSYFTLVLLKFSLKRHQ
jgi:hypothetical protein